MKTTPTIDAAVDFFNADEVTVRTDIKDRVAHTIIDTRSAEGSTVRFYNADEDAFMTLQSDRVGPLLYPLLGEKLLGVRHAYDGYLYAILESPDGKSTCEVKVLASPFVEVQVGPDCEFGRRISAVAVEYGPAAVTVSLVAPFAELVSASRPYVDGEADGLL